MATAETSTFLHKLWEYHLDKRSEKTLYATPVLYNFADKRPLPGKAGTTMYVPRHIGQNLVRALTEYSAITPSGTSAGYYTGTVDGYGDARIYSDFQVDTLMVPTMISDDINDMMINGALKIDSLIQAELSSDTTSTNWITPNGSTVLGSVTSTINLKQRFLFDARAKLALNAAPTYSDGCYWAAINPAGTHDLFVNTSGGGASPLGAGFMESTDVGAKKLEMATIGKLGAVRVVEANNITLKTGAAGTSANDGLSTGATGYLAYVMGPGAVAAVDLATSKLKSFIKQKGSAGTSDPIDQLMTAGVKFYFCAIAMDKAKRLIRTTHGSTIA